MSKISARLRGFMYGRYGSDVFGRFLLTVYLIIIALNLFIRSYILQTISLALACYCIFRIMSRNCYKRSMENQKYMRVSSKLKTEIKLFFDRLRYSKTARFRKCTHCRAIVKLPVKKGRHTVRCPKCGERFEVKI